jgi:hypothetical protein
MNSEPIQHRNKITPLVVLVFLQILGCTAPFSDFQSTHMAGKGQVEVTPSFATVGYAGAQVQHQFGTQFSLGVSDRLDVRARYEGVWIDGSDIDHIDVVGFGPKISLHPDQAALYLPVGFAFGNDIESSKTWEAHPTLIATHVVNRLYEVNVTMKMLISLNDENFNTRIAANLGFGIGPDVMKYVIRPEAGVLFHTSGGDPIYQFGIGLSMATTKRKRSESMGQNGTD